jgi:hypothetical protein
MDRKETRYAVEHVNKDLFASVRRFLNLLVSSKGSYRLDSFWVKDVAPSLEQAEVINIDGNVASIGQNFESFVLRMVKTDPLFGEVLVGYRSFIQECLAEYDLKDDAIGRRLESIGSADEKIVYLTSILSEVSAKLEYMINRSQSMEATLSEMDTALSVVESILDENTDS